MARRAAKVTVYVGCYMILPSDTQFSNSLSDLHEFLHRQPDIIETTSTTDQMDFIDITVGKSLLILVKLACSQLILVLLLAKYGASQLNAIGGGNPVSWDGLHSEHERVDLRPAVASGGTMTGPNSGPVKMRTARSRRRRQFHLPTYRNCPRWRWPFAESTRGKLPRSMTA